MGLECEQHHAGKRLSWEFEDFEKESVGSWLCKQTVGLSASMADSWSWGLTMMVRIWGPTMMLRIWGPTMVLRNWGWTSWGTESWGIVTIVWLRKTFKNCVSLLVSKNRSQKLIKLSYLNNGVAWVFVFTCVFEPAYCVLYLYMYCCCWYHWIMVVVRNSLTVLYIDLRPGQAVKIRNAPVEITGESGRQYKETRGDLVCRWVELSAKLWRSQEVGGRQIII